jgi:hypothetical protein
VAGLRINWRVAGVPLLTTVAIGLAVVVGPRLAEPPSPPEGPVGLELEGEVAPAAALDPERVPARRRAGERRRRSRRRDSEGDLGRPRRKGQEAGGRAAATGRRAARDPVAAEPGPAPRVRTPTAQPAAPAPPVPAPVTPPVPQPSRGEPPAGYREFGP